MDGGWRGDLTAFHEWPRFVARSGPEGRRWVEESWRPERLRLLLGTERALKRLRRGQIREGKDLLDRVADRIDQSERLAEAPASVLLVMKRFYWSTLAYHAYCMEDLDRAGQALDQAHQSIVSALEIAPFLLPLAHHCHEFRLQHARVARKRRRWREMAGHLQAVRAMLDGDWLPLCMLGDGRPIHLSDVTDFYRAIPSLDPAEMQSLRFFFDPAYRRDRIDRFVMSLYVLPGVVIPYP